MSAATAAFLGSGRRMRATVAPPTTVNRACDWRRNLIQLRTLVPATLASATARYCCKNRKSPGDNFPAKGRRDRRPQEGPMIAKRKTDPPGRRSRRREAIRANAEQSGCYPRAPAQMHDGLPQALYQSRIPLQASSAVSANQNSSRSSGSITPSSAKKSMSIARRQ